MAQPTIFQESTLDADGRPYTAQPPQPRIDGSLGVPQSPPDTNWHVAMVSLFDMVRDPAVQISRDSVTLEQAKQLATTSAGGLPTSLRDVATVRATAQPGEQPQQPQQFLRASPYAAQSSIIQAVDADKSSSTATTGASQQGWQEALKRELAQCADAGFFQRPTCSWNVRNKYCEPNQAWGHVAECPARP
jgi:hypothetical protein